MSVFIEGLNQVSRINPPPMGFGRGPAKTTKPRIMLAGVLPPKATPTTKLLAGADAGIIRAESPAALKKCAAAVADIPWGYWPTGQGPLPESDYDFIVLNAQETPLAVPEDDPPGRLLAVPDSLDAGLLHAASQIGMDAVVVSREAGSAASLTWQDLLQAAQTARLLTKPLLLEVPPTVTIGELKRLWEAGVDGVLIELTGSGSPLKALRAAIDETDFSRRRNHRSKALLPIMHREEPAAPEADDDEEYDADD